MDAIASTAFGIDVDSQNHPDDPFVANVEPLLKLDLRARIIFFLSSMMSNSIIHTTHVVSYNVFINLSNMSIF